MIEKPSLYMVKYYETELVINDPQLWWVNGYGEQPLYICAVTLYDENDACADKNAVKKNW